MNSYYRLDWVRQKFDPRDRTLLVSRRLTSALPEYIDQAAGLFAQVPQLDQEQEGSCGANTAAELIDYDELAEHLTLATPSRLFIYYCTRFLMGTLGEDSGVDNRSLMKALAQYGFCPESLWPYDDTPASMVRQPSQECYQAAQANRISNYAAVVQELAQMQGVLAGGRPFLFGFDCFAQLLSDQATETGILTDPPPGATPMGGHDVSLLGYSNSQRPGMLPGHIWPAGHFRFRNHWKRRSDGSLWGDAGYGYISYAYATGPNASDFWVINAVPDPEPGQAPVTPSPHAPFITLTLPRNVPAGGPVTFFAPRPMAAGKYGLGPLGPSATVAIAE